MNLLLSAGFIAFFVLSSIVLFPIALFVWIVTAPFDPRLVALHRFSCFWASLYLWINPAWSVTIRGRERIRPDATYVVVSNHQSMVDILVGYRLFFHFKWVAKAEVFRLPLLGWNMRLNRYVRLRRGSPESVRKMLRACEDHLKQGSSVYLFPEGTRSETDDMRPFKHGAFALAQRMQVPILPIAIDGSRDALPKHSFILRGRHAIHVDILPEIPYAEFADRPVEALTTDVQNTIREAVTARHSFSIS